MTIRSRQFVYHRRIAILVVCAFWAFLTSGCRPAAYRLAPVCGRVTLDDRPLAGAQVTFQPTAPGNPNPGPGSFGRTDAEGKFRLTLIQPPRNGAVVGRHVVRVWLDRPDGTPDRDQVHPLEPNLPPEATNGSLEVEVPSGGTADIELKLHWARR